MIDLQDVLNIHTILIDKFGGIKGLRDKGLLESAINRPYATFDKQDLYPNPEDKAAEILESLLINHPFLDGNKRTAYVLMRLILLDYGLDILANQDDKYKMVIAASTGEMKFEAIKNWIQVRLKNKYDEQNRLHRLERSNSKIHVSSKCTACAHSSREVLQRKSCFLIRVGQETLRWLSGKA